MGSSVCELTTAELFVTEWVDPVTSLVGFDACSEYVETYWLGVIGPSATWVMRFFARELEFFPNGYCLNLNDTAAVLGLSFRYHATNFDDSLLIVVCIFTLFL